MEKLKHISTDDIQLMERFYRANLINSISGYKPANLIGTYSGDGIANLAFFSSVIHLGANPPLLGYIQRPVGELSHTYKNIIRNGSFSINHVHQSFVKNAHYTSAKFADDVSEFEACKLTEEKLHNYNAPFVKESNIKLAMKFVQEIPIKLNRTILIIGQIEHIFLKETSILEDGNVDLNGVQDVCTSGLHTYHKAEKIISLPYAKVDELPNL